MVHDADWGRPDPFGTATIPPYPDSAELLGDLLAGAAELLEGRAATRLAHVHHRIERTAPAGPPLARGVRAWPLDGTSLQILALCLARELSPVLHEQLAPGLDAERIAALLGRGGPAEQSMIDAAIALHPEGALVELELVAQEPSPPGAPAVPWFRRPLRATAAACALATSPGAPAASPGVPSPREPDERLVEIFAAHAEAITVVTGAFDEVARAADRAGARIVAGGAGRARSLAGAIRDAPIADAVPVLVTDELDERVRRLLGRAAGPRWVVIPSPGGLAVATASS